MRYKTGNEENEMNEAKGLFEGERRKSLGIEQVAAQLQKEHLQLSEMLDSLKK